MRQRTNSRPQSLLETHESPLTCPDMVTSPFLNEYSTYVDQHNCFLERFFEVWIIYRALEVPFEIDYEEVLAFGFRLP